MKNMKILLRGIALCLGAFTGIVFAANTAGEVILITGHGTASSADGAVRGLAKGGAIYSGDIVSSGPNSYVNLKFVDGGFILLRPNSRFQVEDFHYSAPEPAAQKPKRPASPANAKSAPPPLVETQQASASVASRAFFSLLKGGFRAVSGLIGHVDRAEYRMSTPVATIGIRGTDYLAIVCDEDCSNDPSITDHIPPGSTVSGGIVVGDIGGGVFVQNHAGKCSVATEPPDPACQGGVNLGPDQYLVNLPDGTQVMLPGEPHFLLVNPIPNPAAICPN
ncbi:MAG: FecR family protein [Stenotrophobium sp.]